MVRLQRIRCFIDSQKIGTGLLWLSQSPKIFKVATRGWCSNVKYCHPTIWPMADRDPSSGRDYLGAYPLGVPNRLAMEKTKTPVRRKGQTRRRVALLSLNCCFPACHCRIEYGFPVPRRPNVTTANLTADVASEFFDRWVELRARLHHLLIDHVWAWIRVLSGIR